MRNRYDAIILAGGLAGRMAGQHKPTVQVGGRTLLDRVLDAVTGAANVVVVGPAVPTSRSVHWTREDPPGGGPAAALGAGMALTSADWVAVLAADLPFVAAGTVDLLLRESAAGGVGAVAVDAGGEPQWLLGVWASKALRSVDLSPGVALRRALGGLDPRTVSVADQAGPPAYLDCDTPADVERARALA